MRNIYIFVQIKSSSGTSEEVVLCDYLVNAGGPWAAEVALMAGIGKKNHDCDVMRIQLPVEPRLRSAFVFRCPTGPTNCPLVIDKNVFWRHESNGIFISGYSPPKVGYTV